MPDLIFDPLETILRQCAGAAPAPWYPSAYARAQGIPRDDLDPALERLRMTGLIRLTEWVKDHGQGYVLTPEGTRVLDNPRDLARLRNGTLSVKAVTQADPRTVGSREMSAWDRGEIIRSAVMSW